MLQDEHVDKILFLLELIYTIKSIDGRIKELERLNFLNIIFFGKISRRINRLKETKKCLEKTLIIVNARTKQATVSYPSLS